MAEALSTGERGLIEEICASHTTWSPAPDRYPRVERLLGGESNRSVLLDGGDRLVLRLGGTPAPGVCRHRELRIHRAAATAGLAPIVRHADPRTGMLVTDYADDSGSATTPEELAALLQGIHALPVADAPEPLGALLAQWTARRGPDSAVTALLAHHGATIEDLEQRLARADDDRPVPCHRDLLAANRRRSATGLMAIDWEYAATGHPFFDLAVCGEELSPDGRDRLLACYLGRPPRADEHELLATFELVYALLAANWYELRYAGSPAAHSACRQLAAALRAWEDR